MYVSQLRVPLSTERPSGMFLTCALIASSCPKRAEHKLLQGLIFSSLFPKAVR
ncbi:hypothetical protein BDV27DRAFT_136873 [Aspergillus caelatus]|uniref:Uncharacterized protein n=1 Tax=Aspergillus caelatus TaxID=61420 RepID=A0A5N6ZMY9_9EURO|nr:uncharacterized protein BDV27DRAFT_136873 [Aspergillus caelatus]KAE8358982.1 hypothetical protein BDV27DRAFT_136873 [Aspergillus caelatus]